MKQIPNIPLIQTISSVGFCSYLLDFDGNVWTFGNNKYGQLGLADTVINIPTKIPIVNIEQIAQGSCGKHFLAKDSQNRIVAMGSNDKGNLGTGETSSHYSPEELNLGVSVWASQSRSRSKSARK